MFIFIGIPDVIENLELRAWLLYFFTLFEVGKEPINNTKWIMFNASAWCFDYKLILLHWSFIVILFSATMSHGVAMMMHSITFISTTTDFMIFKFK